MNIDETCSEINLNLDCPGAISIAWVISYVICLRYISPSMLSNFCPSHNFLGTTIRKLIQTHMTKLHFLRDG
jgi:hypothetical protein